MSLTLRDPSLLRAQAWVNGAWQSADRGRVIEVRNPATRELLVAVPDMGAAETERAIAAAEAAWPAWRARPAHERGAILRQWFELMSAHADDLARILTSEQGKPLAEARGEIHYAALYLQWYAEEAKRVYGETIPSSSVDKRILVLKQPVGVCAAITPWNFPAAMITRKAGPALAAGCAMIVKPARQTPLTALALAELASRAGVPDGVLSVLTGDARAIGAALTASPAVRKLSFTGSTETGRRLMAACAPTVKRMSLELGGNAPFLVFDDADLEAAVEGAIASKYRNSGQTCVCANRFLVQAGVHDRFAEALAERAARLRVGNGMDEGVEQGPLIDEAALRKVEEHVADAVRHGAKILCGGRRHALGGTWFEPTVLTGVCATMRCFREETFGPLAPIARFRTEAEGVALANASELGLAAYFFTRDLARALRVAEDLESGMVGVNTGVLTHEGIPFGGVKQSGLGREGGRYGIEEYLEIKYVGLGGIAPA